MIFLTEAITNWPQAIDSIFDKVIGAIVVIVLIYFVFGGHEKR